MIQTPAGNRFPVLMRLGLLSLLTAAAPSAIAEPPDFPREFRGVWVATVENIDWPSRPGLTVPEQQQEMRALLDVARRLHLNAVILQVRPAADALYASKFEPWSHYLTGEMGQAPTPFYDPLAFAVAEAHARGLELHAWFNPFRARHASAEGNVSQDHISRTRPDLVRAYGGYLWMDPGEPEAVDHAVNVMLDVVRRYDIDGVHLDDYFYPYPIKDERGEEVPFPDDHGWERDQSAWSSRAEWRRHNIDRLIERLYAEIKSAKPWVKVGISPFGIWRPGHPPGVIGFDAYDKLYADARKWVREGWLDYFTPQLYWPVASPGQSYPQLLAWWAEQNRQGRHLWPGNYTSKLSMQEGWPADEILAQIDVTRQQLTSGGNVHFSMKAFQRDAAGINEQLLAGVYAGPALVPASPWLVDQPPQLAAPRTEFDQGRRGGQPTLVLLDETPGAWLWAWQVFDGQTWTPHVTPGDARSIELPAGTQQVQLVAVDRLGRAGASVTVDVIVDAVP